MNVGYWHLSDDLAKGAKLIGFAPEDQTSTFPMAKSSSTSIPR